MFKSKWRLVKFLAGGVSLSLVATALWLFAAGGSVKGETIGDPVKGKQAWGSSPLNFVCQSCHGANGEGAFGPDLAGRKLSVAQWIRQVRKPYGLMPAFPASTISDDTMADVAAYMASLSNVETPGSPRASTTVGDAPGKVLVIEKGCAQCHSANMTQPRAAIGQEGLTRADVINQIRSAFYAPAFNNRAGIMPTFSEKQVTADDAAKIADYLFTSARVPLDVSQKATREGNVVTVNVTVKSTAKAKGMTAGQVFVAGSVPEGAKFLGATATPANSAFRGFEAAGTPFQSAAWLTERLAPGASATYSYQVQVEPGAPTAAHAFVHWLNPSEETVITRDVNP